MAKKLYYKIGEACKKLDIQPYVLRYWETEFPVLAPSKSTSGQRVYSDQDLRVIQRIKELLYEEGYTIAGAKKKLEKQDLSSLGEVRAPEMAPPATPQPESPEEPEPVEVAPTAVVDKAAKKTPSKKTQGRAAPRKPPAKKKAPKSGPSAAEARLRRGVREALKEARAILEILDTD